LGLLLSTLQLNGAMASSGLGIVVLGFRKVDKNFLRSNFLRGEADTKSIWTNFSVEGPFPFASEPRSLVVVKSLSAET
jgi:hypothetical protein